MGIKITALTMRNFLSVGAVTQSLALDTNGLTLVLGSNTDANGELSRNGAGKTTILQAISYALYGAPISRIRPDNLVNNVNQKGMMVTLDFERDGTRYRIERGRKPAVLRFYVDEHQSEIRDEAQGENRHTQEEIERVVGMSHTLFRTLVILNTYTDPFLRMKAAEQREIIEELLGVTQISHRAEVLKKLAGETKDAIKIEEATIRATQEANSRIEVQIAKAERDSASWEANHNMLLHELAENVEGLAGVDFEAEIAAFDAVDAWEAAGKERRSALAQAEREVGIARGSVQTALADAKRYRADAESDKGNLSRRLAADIERREREAEQKDRQADDFDAEAKRLNDDLQNADNQTCVCCGQALTGTAHLETVRASLVEQVAAMAEKARKAQAEAVALREQIETIRQEMTEATEAERKRRWEAEQKADAADARASDAKKVVDEKSAEVVALNAAIAALGPKPDTMFESRDEAYRARQMRDTILAQLAEEERKTNPHTPHIDSLKATLQEVDYTSLNELTVTLKHHDFLLKLLTSKDSFIRKRIIDQNLAYLNGRLNHYLDRLGLPHEVQFMSDLSVEITLLGRSFDFEQLSRGEMNRVIMATSWAFRDMWESMNTSINLMAVDELIDQGTDAQGAEAALHILKGMARDRGKSVFLISHRDDLVARTDSILLVAKQDGFTAFQPDANI